MTLPKPIFCLLTALYNAALVLVILALAVLALVCAALGQDLTPKDVIAPQVDVVVVTNPAPAASTNVTLVWYYVRSFGYFVVQSKDSLTNTWWTIGDVPPGTNGQWIYTYQDPKIAGTGARFYRVETMP